MYVLNSRSIGIFVLLSFGIVAFAQTAQFSGRVSDPQQARVPNARVRVTNQATQVESSVKTNAQGFYEVPFVSPGTYRISVQAQGFSTAISEPLTITVGQELVLTYNLKSATSGMK
jgi:hypothetical protein